MSNTPHVVDPTRLAEFWTVNRLVPFVHVADVQASLDFYAHFGFQSVNVMRGPAGRAFWAFASSQNPAGTAFNRGPAEIMFTQADGPIAPEHQAVIFYMYTENVAELRRRLLSAGLHDGGKFCGQPGPNNGRRVAFEITHPPYMLAGELRVSDPDGYCILVGQYGP